MATLIDLTVKNLKVILRDKVYLFFLLAMPIMIMLMVGLGFRGGATTYAVGYVNNDTGQFSGLFIEKLENATDWGLKDILTMIQYNDADSLKNAFRQGSIKAGLIIDDGYNPMNANETVTFFVDETDISSSWTITSQVMTISGILDPESVPPKDYTKPLDEPIAVEFNMMNFMVVGTLSYAVSTIVFSTAASIAKERDKGTFSRLRTTPMSTMDFLAGGLFSNLIICLIQTLLVFGIAYLLGFRPIGVTTMDVTVNMLAAFVVAALLGIACVGVGLAIAVFAKNEDQAVGVSWFIIIPMMFLSGTWGEITEPTMMKIAWAFPTTYSNKAIRGILARGAPLASMSNYLIGLAVYAAIVFVIGLVLYRKKTM
jgi:ABC-type multidrug transport system permease subunit